MEPIIALHDVSFRYPGADDDTLRNVNLEIAQGDVCSVVGGNGSAKTTLCKTFNGLIPHYWQGEFAGEAIVAGIDTFESSVAELSSHVGYVYQDFQNQLVRPTVRDEISFGPINFGHADHRERTQEALEMLRITELSDKFVWQLSGGQAHLTALASVLALRPEIIVVDEPVAELDPARATEIYERLERLNQEFGLTVITIEHHAEFIARYAKSVVLMSDGAPVWHLPVQEAVNRSGELEDHGIPAPQIVRAAQSLGIAHAPRTVETAAEELRGRIVVKPKPMLIDNPPTPEPPVAEAREVVFDYNTVGGKRQLVLDNLNVTIRRGERVALVGGNGSGKTTLLKLLAGIKVPRTGNVLVDGVNTRQKSAAHLSDHVAYLWQHPQQMFVKDSIYNDIALFPEEREITGWQQLVAETLDQVRLSEFADQDGRALSGGQQRRATLGIGLAMRPTLLLADEPTASLDVTSRDAVTAMLNELAADGTMTSVVATHDMNLVAEWASRVLVMSSGKIAADVTPRELFSQPELLAGANLVPPQITSLGIALGLDPLPLSVAEFVEMTNGS
ncbi:ATP-binding cassette domain-containing protein [Corynebacterium breve]|uniref:ATP-binding cassette domain-containing protein n=1 Tax=Corynebacterium breve TaxID=3049799 RepID=A0ABY8VEC2_9CORY|nr:ATP-binding cassette domain-containing protein [Corynebacterium breve]WIM67829.1 ATP-binding cassette domain-containing protein [Corynebacterium breve]